MINVFEHQWKAGKDAKVVYPWLIQEIRPTLDRLKISTPEELGLDKPEFGLKDVFEMRGPNDYKNKFYIKKI